MDFLVEHKDLLGKKRNLYVVRNRWKDNHHWIVVHLRGNQSDSPHGAKVTVTLADGSQKTQHCLSGHSVWAQHPNTLHFGTGKEVAKQVTIRWPSGKSVKIPVKNADHYLELAP